ncbi:PREDICTED: elongator complex protein 1-like [Nelumbo nucifera]|uniref:Elongator complex protein 1-like n=2 Tax=Nelumbo nucifera TaxID=4432 RepID=A0A1U8QBX2_NELNU|nr:PREDICTED: elongator complex protein 1-like [Nelumbo nucifera]DAD33437.1 TPA_asm: hypothetical protein HUJ06_012288 [Nelumbo nucifera]
MGNILLLQVKSTTLPCKEKIWERDSGSLHAASELKPFMGVALDWMPSGAKIAAAYDRKAENKCPLVVFFERNGLERSSFSIGEPIDTTIEVLKWNCTSDLLAAIARCERHGSVKIWSFSNNHWYLKHEIRYLKKDGVKFMWDPTKALRLICLTLGGKITAYNFVWVTAVMENSTDLVIENFNILISPLALSFNATSLVFIQPEILCCCSRYGLFPPKHLAMCLSSGSLCIVEIPATETWEELEGKEFNIVHSCSEVEFGSLIQRSGCIIGCCHKSSMSELDV